jgi:hypothetical protein
MSEGEWLAGQFEENRSRLRAVAQTIGNIMAVSRLA